MDERPIAETIAYVFVDLAVIVVVARVMGRLAVRVGQPAVVGEIIAGILLGPTLLGSLPGGLDELLFPADVRPHLNVLAQLGLVLFMFLVGLEVDLSFVRGRERIAISVSVASIVLPFALGFVLATLLHPRHDVVGGEPVGFLPFALFLGVAMSITAFPVLARILAERGMHRIPTGVLSLACAAVDDVLAWALLAVVVAIVAAAALTDVVGVLAFSALFVLVAFLVVRPLLGRLVTGYARAGKLTSDMLAVVLVGILVSAWATEEIGVHFIFGAFVFGVVMPRQGAAALTHEITDRLEQVSVLLLLPVFFVVTGLGVNVGAIDLRGLGELALILLVAIVGKFAGAFVAARTQRVPRRQATALAVLMNTRGLTELVILSIGRQLGVLDDRVFTLLVVMAVVTTVMTSPLLTVVYPRRVLQRDIAAAERAAMGLADAYTVLVVVDDPRRDAALVQLACDLLGPERPAQLVLTRVLRRSRPRPEVATGLGADLALLAAAGDELRQLARAVEARGIPASVASRFTDAPGDDVRELAVSADADVVLARSGGPADIGRLAGLPGTVVVVSGDLGAGPDAGGPVAVATADAGAGADGRAALRLAAQAAVSRSVPLQLRTGEGWRAGRRAAALAESLRRVGVELAPDQEAPPALLVVPQGVALDGHAAAPVLTVQAGPADRDRDMDETLAAITARRPR